MEVTSEQALAALVLVELTLAFIVFCADSLPGPPRPPLQRLVRSVFWMVTLGRWITHRNVSKLGRFAAIVWFLVTTGWLLTLEYDRTGRMNVFLMLAQATMAFVVYAVDATSADGHDRRLRRLIRSAFWMKALTGYMKDEDSIKVAYATLTVWVLLTTGWLLTMGSDRIVRPLGLAP